MAMYGANGYKHVEKDGITAIIIHGSKVLLLKRRNIPLLINRGIWAFLSGSLDRGEGRLEAAYREIKEEVGIADRDLMLLLETEETLKDDRKMISWSNGVFVFRSRTSSVRLDLENSAYRWASLGDIVHHTGYTNVFINESHIVNRLRVFLNVRHVAEGKTGQRIQGFRRP